MIHKDGGECFTACEVVSQNVGFCFLFEWVVWVWRSWFQHGLSAKSGIPFLEIDAFLCDRPLGLNFIFGNEVLMEGVGFGWRELM